MDETQVRALAEQFYRAFLRGNRAELDQVLAPGAIWTLPLQTRISGSHRGAEGAAELRTLFAKLTDDTWCPLRSDSYDIAASPWHAVIMDRFLASREARRLDSHELVVVAVEDGRIVRLFHYLHDPAGWAEFWS
jgi:ketosteroid isomerase-like protein